VAQRKSVFSFVAVIERAMSALVHHQVSRPAVVLFLAALTVLPSAWVARGLELRTGFGELLPENMPSVVELRRIGDRLPSVSILAVTAESRDSELLKRFVDEMTPKLRELPKDLVTGVENGSRDARLFFEANQHLYADTEDLAALRDDVVARFDWEMSKALGTALDEDYEPPRVDAESVRSRFEKRLDAASSAKLGDYYLGEDGHLVAIVVRTPLHAMDQRAFDLQGRITRLVEAGGYETVDPSFRIGFTGNLVTSAEEYRSVVDDLTSVGAMGGGLVLTVVFLFFWRLRAMVALGFSIALGCLWCFAFAKVAIGHLNTASGFLVSVIAGNGINAMVIYMARFIEARRDQKMALHDAVRTASLDTWVPTLAAVGVSMVSYGALMTTDFRGFRHFGIIGAAGMLLCWIATYSTLPAILVLADRLRPFSSVRGHRDRLSGLYARPFVWLSKRFPGPVALLGLASAVVASVATISYFASDPMEYDMRRLRNDELSPTSARTLSDRIGPVIGRLSQAGRAVMVDRLDQVEPLVKELERRRDAAPPELEPFGQVASIYSLLPKDQDRKLALLSEIDDRMQRAYRRGFVSDADLQEVRKRLPEKLRRIEISDLPEQLVAPFRERNGTVGNIVYIAPSNRRSINDARYLMLWADSYREVPLPTGEVIRGTGDAVIFTDMLRSIAADAPRVALLSTLGTAVVIVLTFGGRRSGLLALGTLGLGIAWLVASLSALGVKLNFLNFVALPIAIGVGSDYAINVLKRREIEGDSGIERAFTETGGAVVACSMTTLSGYTALLFSINGAVRSMGLTAAFGELATQFSAMLVLPAFLYWIRKRRGSRTSLEESISRRLESGS
jgi:predicted RND superfamily exporter protein